MDESKYMMGNTMKRLEKDSDCRLVVELMVFKETFKLGI